jgi:catalase
MFSYPDSQMYRLGVNNQLLPINEPVSEITVANEERDGMFRSDINQDGAPNYYPNSFNGPRPDPLSAPSIFSASGVVAR